MSSQHLSDDLCLDYLTGELPVGEAKSHAPSADKA